MCNEDSKLWMASKPALSSRHRESSLWGVATTRELNEIRQSTQITTHNQQIHQQMRSAIRRKSPSISPPMDPLSWPSNISYHLLGTYTITNEQLSTNRRTANLVAMSFIAFLRLPLRGRTQIVTQKSFSPVHPRLQQTEVVTSLPSSLVAHDNWPFQCCGIFHTFASHWAWTDGYFTIPRLDDTDASGRSFPQCRSRASPPLGSCGSLSVAWHTDSLVGPLPLHLRVLEQLPEISTSVYCYRCAGQRCMYNSSRRFRCEDPLVSSACDSSSSSCWVSALPVAVVTIELIVCLFDWFCSDEIRMRRVRWRCNLFTIHSDLYYPVFPHGHSLDE